MFSVFFFFLFQGELNSADWTFEKALEGFPVTETKNQPSSLLTSALLTTLVKPSTLPSSKTPRPTTSTSELDS
jgi:hypothetical protein